MAETLIISASSDKGERYKSLLPQIEALIADEKDLTANLANIAAALRYGMNFFWVGFYLVKGNELVFRTVSGACCLYENTERQGGVWEMLGGKKNTDRGKC